MNDNVIVVMAYATSQAEAEEIKRKLHCGCNAKTDSPYLYSTAQGGTVSFKINENGEVKQATESAGFTAVAGAAIGKTQQASAANQPKSDGLVDIRLQLDEVLAVIEARLRGMTLLIECGSVYEAADLHKFLKRDLARLTAAICRLPS